MQPPQRNSGRQGFGMVGNHAINAIVLKDFSTSLQIKSFARGFNYNWFIIKEFLATSGLLHRVLWVIHTGVISRVSQHPLRNKVPEVDNIRTQRGTMSLTSVGKARPDSDTIVYLSHGIRYQFIPGNFKLFKIPLSFQCWF